MISWRECWCDVGDRGLHWMVPWREGLVDIRSMSGREGWSDIGMMSCRRTGVMYG